MNSAFKKLTEKPILLLLVVNILVGLFVFRDYGFSWDEPLFYDYGDALGYAYSPTAWFSGNFELNNSYGSSGDDHKTRGPAYLLLAREPVYLLEALALATALSLAVRWFRGRTSAAPQSKADGMQRRST